MQSQIVEQLSRKIIIIIIKYNQSAQLFSCSTNIYNDNQKCAGVHMVPILNLVKIQGLQDAKQVEESNIDGQAEVNSIL